MIIPWRVDVPEERWPYSNWIIIAGAITAFVFQSMSISPRRDKIEEKFEQCKNRSVEEVAKEYGVEQKRLEELEKAGNKIEKEFRGIAPSDEKSRGLRDTLIKRAILEEYFVWGGVRPFILHGLSIKGLFGHIWIHAGLLHLLGNMLFLWIFGNAVCAKIGNLRYFPVYLCLGLMAGIAHLLFTGGGALGASGAINGVVGMYTVLFPLNDITCYFVFLFPLIKKEFSLSSYWMILFWLGFDIWGATQGGGHVAYFAHIGGFAGGFVLAIVMLKLKIITMERYEKSLLQIIDEYRNPAKDEYKTQYGGYLGLMEKEIQDQPEAIATKEPEREIIPFVPEIPREEYIRFVCRCGKKLKMSSQYAGKTGKCPKCNTRLRIPDK